MTQASMVEADNDAMWMRLAIDEAVAAMESGDVPVGCVVVLGGEVIGRGRNRREADQDPTAHAEMIALREASRKLGTWRLEGAVVYATLEPCPMCAGALVNARVGRLVFGCRDPKGGAVRSLFRLVDDARLNHRMAVREGVLAEPCGRLLSSFFADLRRGEV